VLVLLFGFTTYILIYIFPVSYKSELFGPYNYIGTTTFNFPDPCSKGEISAQCWYPLVDNQGNNNRAILWTSGCPEVQEAECFALLEQIAHLNKIPSLLLNHLVLTRTNSIYFKDIMLSSFKNLPIAIYSHGLYGWRQGHHSACERLASEGFVVFSIDHAPDSTLARTFKSPNNNTKFNFLPPKGCSIHEDRDFHSSGVERRHSQLLALINHIKNDSYLVSSLDVNKIFLWGHSYGGCTMASIACKEKFASGLAILDGWFYPLSNNNRSLGLKTPTMILSSKDWPTGKYQIPFKDDLISKTKNSIPVYDYILNRINHQNFCDTHFICNQMLLNGGSLLGNFNAKKVIDIIDASIIGFFKDCLEYSENKNKSDESNGLNQNLEYFCAKYFLQAAIINSKKTSQSYIKQTLEIVKSLVADPSKNASNLADYKYFNKFSK